MDHQITQANNVAYTFASKYSSSISEALAAQATDNCPPPDHADNQRTLDVLTQNNLFSRAQLSFDFGLTYPSSLNLKSGCDCKCFSCLPCFCPRGFVLDDDTLGNMTESTSRTCSTSTTLSMTTRSSTKATTSSSILIVSSSTTVTSTPAPTACNNSIAGKTAVECRGQTDFCFECQYTANTNPFPDCSNCLEVSINNGIQTCMYCFCGCPSSPESIKNTLAY